jgi:ADP-ribose pyrophosphatase
VRDAKVVYRGRKFDVQLKRLRGRDGRSLTHEAIVHPGAAVILPLLPDGRILFVRVLRHTIDRELLELPAGTLDPPESPRTCAARELREETGYSARSLRKLISFFSSPGICTERMHAYLATHLRPGPQTLEPGEFIRLSPLTLADALASVQNGRIADAKTIVTLLYYDRFVVSRRKG